MTAPAFVHSPWIPADDLLLRNSMQKGASIISLAKGAVKFSRKYTFLEIRDRWYSLLYDPDVSDQCCTPMFEHEHCGSNPLSKPKLDNLKGSEKVPEKRKNGSIRRHYHAMRKRLKNDFFSSQNLGTTHDGDTMLDDCLANNLGFEEKDFEILRQAFPESLGAISTTVTTTTTIVADNPVNSFHLEKCHKSAEKALINELMMKNASPGPSETPPNEKLNKNDKSVFGGKHHISSPISDGSASCHTIGGFPSPSTRFPLWKTMEDVSAPDMPVDENNAQSHQVAEETLALHEDNSFLDFDLSLSGDKPNGLINSIEYTDSLLNLSNEDDILLVDADTQEVDMCNDDAATSPVAKELKDSSFQELTEGKIICTLNTEDTDIPCNDDIFLLIHPSTQFAPSAGLQIATDSIGPLSSSSREKDGEQGLIKVSKGKNPPVFTRSLKGGPNAGPAFKREPPDGEYRAPLPGKPNSFRKPSQTMPVHTPLEISGKKMKEDASKSDLSSSAMYKEMPLPLEVGSVKMTDLKSMDDTYISENNSDSDGDIPDFSDVEAMILKMELATSRKSSITSDVARYKNEDAIRRIMRLEQAARSSFQRVMSSRGALAIFYGRHLKHYIKKAEVTIGRSTDDIEVDIDLRKEGRANKISRRQAIIKMETDGSFSLKNLGSNSISLNGQEVAHGQVVALASSSSIEIRGMSFVFEINDKYVRRFLVNKPS